MPVLLTEGQIFLTLIISVPEELQLEVRFENYYNCYCKVFSVKSQVSSRCLRTEKRTLYVILNRSAKHGNGSMFESRALNVDEIVPVHEINLPFE